MGTNIFLAVVGIGLPFCLIAATMAYLITYEEYQHHYPTKEEPRRLAWQAAGFTLLIFSLITVFTAFMLSIMQ